jgi:hypothetical protein
MKLMFCAHCSDIVKLLAEVRTCACGNGSGRYLEDGDTTVHAAKSLSIGLASPDFATAVQTLVDEPEPFALRKYGKRRSALTGGVFLSPESSGSCTISMEGRVTTSAHGTHDIPF